MDFLDRVDFENHDGVYLSMLNDVARNQFYDQILTEVYDQHCVEIGFGTGLLSMLALKHGARSIVAYESDPDRYRLGCEVIKLLGLQDRITLINQRYKQ
jgi:predicted RNA methylase